MITTLFLIREYGGDSIAVDKKDCFLLGRKFSFNMSVSPMELGTATLT